MVVRRTRKSDSVKIQVTFTKEQARKLADLRGIMGDSDSEVVRTIVAGWLIDRE